MREGFLEDERLEAGDGAQQLPGQGPHILWDRLSLASPLFLKDQSQFFLSPYMFHPELGMGAWREIGHRPGPKEWRSSWGQWPEAKVVAAGADRPLSRELLSASKLFTSLRPQLQIPDRARIP